MPFVYPVELDGTTRLRSGEKASESSQADLFEERRLELLEEAREILETARRRDREYATTLVNLACVADILGERDEALLLAGKAVRLAEREGQIASLTNALVIRGIARYRGDPSDEVHGRQDMERAAETGSPLAAANLRLITNSAAAPSVSGGSGNQRSDQLEEIAGFSLLSYDALVTDPDAVAAVERVSRSQPAIDIYVKRSDTWSSLVIETRYNTITVVATEDGYTGKTRRGIALGSSLAALADAYGGPGRSIASRQGEYRIYDDSGILFLTDKRQRVERWMVYGIDQ